MAIVQVWVEYVDYSTAVGDQDPIIRDIGQHAFTGDTWIDALDAAYNWIKNNYNPKHVYHVNL